MTLCQSIFSQIHSKIIEKSYLDCQQIYKIPFIIKMQSKYWFKRALPKTQKPQQTRSLSESRFIPAHIQLKHFNIIAVDGSFLKTIQKSSEKIASLAGAIQSVKQFHRLSFGDQKQAQGEVRCFRHNSGVIMYCTQDHQLLCPNCLFGSSIHKGHQVIQVHKAHNMIQSDIQKGTKQVQNQLKDLRMTISQCEQIKQTISVQYENTLIRLQQQHNVAQMQLSKIFMTSKQQLKKHFQDLRGIIQNHIICLNNMRISANYQQLNHNVKQILLNQIGKRLKQFEKQQVDSMILLKLQSQFEKQTKKQIALMKKMFQNLKC